MLSEYPAPHGHLLLRLSCGSGEIQIAVPSSQAHLRNSVRLMKYKICCRCQFNVEVKAKLCRICGYRKFFDLEQVEQKPEKNASPIQVSATLGERTQSIFKRIAASASAFLA
jgi:hypothetical protein